MRTQHVDYAVWETKSGQSYMTGWGYTDKARFIFHMGSTAFLFGRHEGRTLVVEFLTSGFLLRFRLMQTEDPPKPDQGVKNMERKTSTAILRLGSIEALADGSGEERESRMILSDNLVAGVKNLPARLLNQFRFFRLVPIPPEELFQAAEEALQEKRQEVEEEIRTRTQELQEAETLLDHDENPGS